jgi:gliding motility-associated-like protein
VDSLCKNLAFYPSISVPNFFTPNNDLVNDELEILSSNAEVLIQRIYNRWGNLVFESTDPSVFWDGKVNGALAAAGVYFLEIEAKNAYSEGYPVIERHAVHLIH